ncbi:MAG: hypothetical protein ABSH09_17260 [Bryobacteraceae bacterium]|jgi:hypothetical protein
MRTVLISVIVAAAFSVAQATTLQQLSLNDMILKSSAIVRGQVQITGSTVRGSNIYTQYTVKVIEQWKGAPAAQINFAVPGGTANGLRQTIAGSPSLNNGQEYVLYLWTSRSGLTQIIGLSQGLFVSANGVVTRPSITEHFIDPNGSEAADPGMQMTLSAMRALVTTVLGQAGNNPQ